MQHFVSIQKLVGDEGKEMATSVPVPGTVSESYVFLTKFCPIVCIISEMETISKFPMLSVLLNQGNTTNSCQPNITCVREKVRNVHFHTDHVSNKVSLLYYSRTNNTFEHNCVFKFLIVCRNLS